MPLVRIEPVRVDSEPNSEKVLYSKRYRRDSAYDTVTLEFLARQWLYTGNTITLRVSYVEDGVEKVVSVERTFRVPASEFEVACVLASNDAAVLGASGVTFSYDVATIALEKVRKRPLHLRPRASPLDRLPRGQHRILDGPP